MSTELPKDILLVRTGEADSLLERSGLSDLGRRQAEAARDELIAKELVPRILVLSSTSPHVVETSQIIGKGLEAEVRVSNRLGLFGVTPELMQGFNANLDDVLAFDLGKLPEDQTVRTLIAVSSAPLIAMALGQESGDYRGIASGSIHPYEPGAWAGLYPQPVSPN